MATPPKKPSKTAVFRKTLRVELLAHLQALQTEGNARPFTVAQLRTVPVEQLEHALLHLKNDEALQAQMPTKEAFATQFDLAFKEELARVLPHQQRVQAELQQAHTEALNYLLQGCTTANHVRNILGQAAGCGFGLFQRATGLPVELCSAHVSTKHPGEEWGHFQNRTEGATSCCQFRALPEFYEFRPL